ncbi:uncharacterized protein B0H64DRAFT_394294 [Chaetomium fimeti]|uniref:DUF6594 domain-containing protein n=1 Tax=Chaetomium fimeti TaxID=1854472 RepID=A0AAE0HEK8_9PEZI|nr:hypothetical protein B0H64DRAFT_394294 [Chaetomium fimeti]
MYRFRAVLSSWRRWWPATQRVEDAAELLPVAEIGVKACPIEEYPSGYPQYSALISSYGPFFAFRSFRQLRARLLLLQQDEIGVLEARLNQVDREEASPFYLGTCRGDRNVARADIITQIHSKLADYDALVERCRQMLAYSRGSPRDVASLQNWLDQTGCLTREETAYLDQPSDLITLASPTDSALKRLEDWVEDRLVRHYKRFRVGLGHDISTNPTVYVPSGPFINNIARALMLCLITFLLLAPVIVCILVKSFAARVVVIAVSTALYLTVLSLLTRSRMLELILAGATFATVLTVFVSNSVGV